MAGTRCRPGATSRIRVDMSRACAMWRRSCSRQGADSRHDSRPACRGRRRRFLHQTCTGRTPELPRLGRMSLNRSSGRLFLPTFPLHTRSRMDTRMLWRHGVPAALVIALCPSPGAAQTQPVDNPVKLDDGESVRISGLVSGTVFVNRALFGAFGQGQNAEWADKTELRHNNTFADGDIRNTRLRFDFSAGEVFDGWSPRATVAVDFFGGQDAPPFGDEQPRLRVRVAYADLTNGRTTVRIGQNYAPLLGELPQSASHVAFPLGFGSAGAIGWRFPGVFVYHDLARGRQTTLGLQLAVMKGSGPIPSGAAVPVGTGEASGLPQLEGRLDLGGRAHGLAWGTYLVGHVDWKALNGLEHSEVDSRKPQAVFSCRCQS